MRAWVCLLLSIVLAPDLVAQCSYPPVLSDQFRATFLDLTIDGSDLWAATGYGLSLYDRSVDPPVLVASIAIPGTTRVVRVANGLAYAGSGTSIAIVRKNGRTLQLVRSIDTGATINDLIATPLDLYVASSAGLVEYDLLDPTNPSKTPATLATSSANVQSLTILNSFLFAAAGDATVEVFDVSIPSLPQSTGALTSSIARPTSVRTANGKLYVSDGRTTELWSGGAGPSMTRAGAYAFGGSAVASIFGDSVFLGGADRTLRAYDLSAPSSPVGLFTTVIPTTGGNINRIGAVASSNNRLYAAAGDAGLLTYDTTSFLPPFPMRNFPAGASTSMTTVGGKLYVSNPNGGITEFSQNATGLLTQARTWDGSHVDLVFDGNSSAFLLSGSGATLTLWTVQSTIPAPISSVTFRQPVTAAVLIDFTAFAVLSDRTLWKADMSLQAPVASQVQTSASPTSIARSGTTFAVADPKSDGTTTVTYFTSLQNAVTVPGVTTTPVAFSGTTAAIFTFRGINLIDFANGTTTVLPQSGGNVARALAVTPAQVLELTDTALVVWDRATQRMTAQYVIPSAPVAMLFTSDSGAPIADVATVDGITSVALNAPAALPASISAPNANAFFKKLIATPQRVLLSDQSLYVEIYTPSLHHTATLRAPGMLDVAAGASGTYVLSGNRAIGAYSIDGAPLAQTTLNDTTDTQPLAINTAGNAVWVSYSRGCLTSQCEKRTNVYDASLSQTSSFAGAVIDLAVSGNRAYVLTDLPAEIRVYDITDPLHPAQLASRATEGALANNSIAVSGNTLYAIGEKLYAYDAATLAKTGEQLPSFTASPSFGISAVDQHIRIDGGCAMITGRGFDAALYPLGSATGTPIGGPATSRNVAQQPGRFYVLTDDSLEVFSTTPLTSPPHHRAAR